MYAKREKAIVRLTDDPTASRKAEVILPAMAFELTETKYNSQSKLPSLHKIVQRSTTDHNRFKMQYTPVPYDLSFKLYIFVKNFEDGFKIVEQILPFFTPDFTATLELIPELNINQDIPVILNSVTLEDVYSEDYKERRLISWELGFTLKGYIYGPVKEKPIIKFANVEFSAPNPNTTAAQANGTSFLRITTQPGELANGSPTTNAALTIAWANIDVQDTYGIINTKTLLF